MKRIAIAVLLLLAAPLLSAQTLTFTAETVTGVESVVPKLTWSTNPVATACVASDGWTGTKTASGSETLPAISATKTFVMVCSWASDLKATLSWSNPTKNTDGSDYSNAKAIRIRYGLSAAQLTQTTDVLPPPLPTPTSYVVNALNPNTTYFFQVWAVNSFDVESAASPTVQKTTKAASNTSRTVGITVNPRPNAVTNLTVE
jgi:hypothetical protein